MYHILSERSRPNQILPNNATYIDRESQINDDKETDDFPTISLEFTTRQLLDRENKKNFTTKYIRRYFRKVLSFLKSIS